MRLSWKQGELQQTWPSLATLGRGQAAELQDVRQTSVS
jgi:hypothetical protein